MKNGIRAILLLLGDVAMLVAAFIIMLEISFPGQATGEPFKSHSTPFMFVFLIWLFVFFLFNLYETKLVKPTIPNLRRIGIASIVALTSSTIMFYIVPAFGITPKTNLIIFSITFILLFLSWRRIFYSIFAVYFKKYVAFIVDTARDSAVVRELAGYIEAYPQSGFSVFGIYSSSKEFFEKKGAEKIDTLIVSKNTLKENDDLKIIYSTVENILDLTYAYEDMLGKIPVDAIDESWFLHNIHSSNKNIYSLIKRILNILASSIALIITSPFILIVAICIKIEDGGPVFYNQQRVGKNNKNFKLYKIRSMFVNADKNGAEWTEKNDTRITRVGKIIRKLHIDEVPQLWNIIIGDMSLVGPRPELPSFVEKLEREIPHYDLRHIVKPGFTGWAQIKFRNARGIAESKEKFEFDLFYIKNRNVFMDIGILIRTIQIIFTH